ncbi:glycerol-3-phosphate dehydrogenase [Afipia sp. 1NLS2]|uniref:glycerol-3-phosphate dehydrogenase n=1 Tax=Afipia sp. 1NLS2 TaxID=666684 RepID=UPI0001D9E0FB|nr:glycerol-3-phosphate dehydrogenase [Afipia sp. 1NLS2]EFI51478.1 Glycerol-3-phosphate dehydrogenase [Afipia sp. 1NLS2]
MEQIYDLAVIGGGVNGCGIARDAAGRGYSVYLCEMNDLASGTSSWSSKLIHGGLRYLEFYEFRLVREALIEREVLWGIAPHIIAPERFVLPHHDGLRPAWLLRLGLFIYDHLGGRRRLPATRTLNLRRDIAGKPLKPIFKTGFEYSDCTVDDARLVVLNALDAVERGAMVATRTQAVQAKRGEDGVWELVVEDTATKTRSTIKARILVNAGGPWVQEILTERAGVEAKAHVRLVQGSHIVVPRLYAHDHAYTFQHGDGRVIFVIPYQDDFTLIGTTDRDYEGDPSKVRATQEEIDYLCASASEYLATPVQPSDVVWSYSGVRPLYDDHASEARTATRDYVFELDVPDGLPILSVFGGKITTYRKLAEHALEKLSPYLRSGGAPWTGGTPLPGGDFAVGGVDALTDLLLQDYPFLPRRHARRLVRAYGSHAKRLLGRAAGIADLGRDFGHTLTEREVRYLMAHEFAQTAEDVVWRRSKLGLWLTQQEVATLDAWMATQRKPVAPDPY